MLVWSISLQADVLRSKREKERSFVRDFLVSLEEKRGGVAPCKIDS